MQKAFSKWSFSVAWMELGQNSLCLTMKNEQNNESAQAAPP
jgi:hypothetical protein